MSKKTYTMIANEIKNQVAIVQDAPHRMIVEATLFMVASNLAIEFGVDNARFDRNKFMNACGFAECGRE